MQTPMTNPVSPEAIAALRAHPHFSVAMRASSSGAVALYQGNRVLNWLMDDRGRVMFGYYALYLHFKRDPAVPASGLTPTNIKGICKQLDICSPGRATVMLSLMRFAGYLANDPAQLDRRHHRLLATERLIEFHMVRWRLHFIAMAPMLPDGEALLQALEDREFIRRFLAAMCERILSGFRLVYDTDPLRLFARHKIGMIMLASLTCAGAADDTVPPSRPIALSVSELARRFSVSRAHVLKLLHDSETEGFLTRSGRDGNHIVMTSSLADGLQEFWARTYVYFAVCARDALREIDSR